MPRNDRRVAYGSSPPPDEALRAFAGRAAPGCSLPQRHSLEDPERRWASRRRTKHNVFGPSRMGGRWPRARMDGVDRDTRPTSSSSSPLRRADEARHTPLAHPSARDANGSWPRSTRAAAVRQVSIPERPVAMRVGRGCSRNWPTGGRESKPQAVVALRGHRAPPPLTPQAAVLVVAAFTKCDGAPAPARSRCGATRPPPRRLPQASSNRGYGAPLCAGLGGAARRCPRADPRAGSVNTSSARGRKPRSRVTTRRRGRDRLSADQERVRDLVPRTASTGYGTDAGENGMAAVLDDRTGAGRDRQRPSACRRPSSSTSRKDDAQGTDLQGRDPARRRQRRPRSSTKGHGQVGLWSRASRTQRAGQELVHFGETFDSRWRGNRGDGGVGRGADARAGAAASARAAPSSARGRGGGAGRPRVRFRPRLRHRSRAGGHQRRAGQPRGSRPAGARRQGIGQAGAQDGWGVAPGRPGEHKPRHRASIAPGRRRSGPFEKVAAAQAAGRRGLYWHRASGQLGQRAEALPLRTCRRSFLERW